jgi:hypothetical protein
MSGWGYGGTIGTTTKFDDTAGVIIFRYTQAPTGMDADETAAIEKHVMGKYTAVYYKSLTANSVQMSTVSQYDQQDPNNLDKTYPIANSLGAARIKFTADKTGDFISLWGDYTK